MTESGLTAGDAARQLGIAVTTLRTWHQRYGLGPQDYTPGHHRRYSTHDMFRLAAMQRLTNGGMPAAQAARSVLTSTDAATPAVRGRHGGGSAIPLGHADAATRGLAHMAMRLNSSGVVETLTTSINDYGVVHTWDHLIRPVLAGLARRQRGNATLIEVEHLFSRAVSEAFTIVPRPGSDVPARAMLACAAEEQHTLPLEALAAALAEAGIGCRNLGPRLPSHALASAVRRIGPTAVAIWSQSTETNDPRQLAALLALRPRPIIVAAGPGWQPAGLPDSVVHPGDLAEALNLMRPAHTPLPDQLSPDSSPTSGLSVVSAEISTATQT